LRWGWGIGDWGLGIGDWGLGPLPNPQSPIPNPQSPIPKKNLINHKFYDFKLNIYKMIFLYNNYFILKVKWI